MVRRYGASIFRVITVIEHCVYLAFSMPGVSNVNGQLLFNEEGKLSCHRTVAEETLDRSVDTDLQPK